MTGTADPYCAPEASLRYVLEEVRAHDRDRFLGALFAPEPERRDLLAILAFDRELARTQSVAREPMLKRIRLQWWREAVHEAAGASRPRAQPIVESLSETVRRHALRAELLVALIDAREDEVEGALDVLRTGRALADLQLAVLEIDHGPTRAAAHAIAAAWLMGPGPERDALVAEARGHRPDVDEQALPILLPALSLSGIAQWRKPLAYWWSARRGRY